MFVTEIYIAEKISLKSVTFTFFNGLMSNKRRCVAETIQDLVHWCIQLTQGIFNSTEIYLCLMY